VVGANIRAIRRQQHLTQSELGRRIGMLPAPINNIELGKGLPSTPVLCRIAAVLGVSVDALLGKPSPYVREAVGGVSETPAVYAVRSEERGRYRVPVSRPTFVNTSAVPLASPVHLLPASGQYAPSLLTLFEDLVHAYLTLEDLCGATRRAAIPLTLAMPHTEAGIEDLAMRVRTLLGVGPAVIFDYMELFENAGLRVIFAPLPNKVQSAACYDRQNENAFLFITTGRIVNTERQLFRLVYELGRIYCHTGGVTQVAGRAKPLDAGHVAAKFTAFFLMPAEAVHATVRQIGVRSDGWTWELLLRIKHRFGVSAETFLYRLDELGLIAPKPLADLKARIKAYYDRTRHAEPDGSRRILSRNGRLGDLLLAARAVPDAAGEYAAVRAALARHGVRNGMPARLPHTGASPG